VGRRWVMVAASAAIVLCAVGGALWVSLAGRPAPVHGAWTGIPTPASTSADGYEAVPNDFAVACTSVTWCMAVGSSSSEEGAETARAAIWNGHRWSYLAMPAATVTTQEPGGTSTETTFPDAVSCSSPNWCVATSAAYVQSWNGRHWSSASPLPGSDDGTISDFTQVVPICSSATRCVAVGSGGIDTWNGRNWSMTPGIAASSQFRDVACTSATWCVAVGETSAGEGDSHPLVDMWDGHLWSQAETVPIAGYVFLSDVSCASQKWCMAVGTAWASASSSTSQPLVEAWDGSSWSSVSGRGLLQGVPEALVCVSTTSCRVDEVTYPSLSPIHEANIQESWDGAEWTMVPASRAVSADGLFIACPVNGDACQVSYPSSSVVGAPDPAIPTPAAAASHP